MEITEQNLLDDGWVKTDDSVTPFRKDLTLREGEDAPDEDEGSIELVYSRMYGEGNFAISLPDGALLYINVSSMEELKVIEKSIMSYDPPY